MRIIQISPSYKPAYLYGGPTLSIALLCEALVESGVASQVFTTTANGEADFETSKRPVDVDGVQVTYHRRIIGGQFHLSLSLLSSLLFSTKKTDIFHVHSWWNATAVLSALIGKIKGNKVILSPRGMLTAYTFNSRNAFIKNTFHRLLARWVLSYCHIHVTTTKEEKDVTAFIKHANTTTIPNFVNQLYPAPDRLFLLADELTVMRLVFLSRIEEKKGLDLLFQSLKELQFPWVLTVAGDGDPDYIKYLQLLAKEFQIDIRIKWVGFVDAKEKSAILSSHDLLVLFSYNENFANVVTESLSMGLPVAISKEVGLSDFVIEHDLGWVSDLNIPSIITALEDAARDISKRKRIKQTAPLIVRQHFNSADILLKYRDLYAQDE